MSSTIHTSSARTSRIARKPVSTLNFETIENVEELIFLYLSKSVTYGFETLQVTIIFQLKCGKK
jgi:hypothetical protein